MARKIAITLFFFLTFLIAPKVLAADKINLYFFYGDGCPHCAKEEVFLDQLEAENRNITVRRFEVWHNRDNAALLAKIAKELKLKVSGVPVLIVGEETIVGFSGANTTGEKIKRIIDRYAATGCEDRVATFLGGAAVEEQCVHGCDADDTECLHNCGCEADTGAATVTPGTVSVPFFGEVNIKNMSLPLLTFVLAGADGFNPCAMWVLLFLIGLLIGMPNRTRMWLLGLAFIITSAAVYFLFLAAWLNLFLFLGFVLWIRLAIGAVAVGSGGYHLREWWKNRAGGCPMMADEKRRRVFDRLKGIINERNFLFALAGIIILAGAVNLVELVCSAGLPAVYTQVLTLAGLEKWEYYAYLLFYILIFMVDDLLVFFIAMFTLELKAVQSRYTRYAGLVGGAAMLIIGLILIFKPGWIMF